MKRLVAAIVLLVFAAGVAIWSGYLFETRMDYFENQLFQLLAAPESELQEVTENVVDEWEKHAEILHSVFIHDGIDELEILITSLPMTLEYSGRDGLNEKCIEGIVLIKNLKACEKLTLENVL